MVMPAQLPGDEHAHPGHLEHLPSCVRTLALFYNKSAHSKVISSLILAKLWLRKDSRLRIRDTGFAHGIGQIGETDNAIPTGSLCIIEG